MDSTLKIGILYICTGKYDRFFLDFYESSEKMFMNGIDKTYFVWTDSSSTDFDKPNVVKIDQPRLGWPYDTLMRFQMFFEKQDELSKMEYVFFLNANMKFLKPVSTEILPDYQENGLVAVLHSTFYNTSIPGTFERNPISTAYIPLNENPLYFQGCFFGGRTPQFLEMVKVCKKNIETDLEKKYIAVWWDESHMNKYFKEKIPKCLHPGYAYPESYSISYDKLIIQKNKQLAGGHNFLRS